MNEEGEFERQLVNEIPRKENSNMIEIKQELDNLSYNAYKCSIHKKSCQTKIVVLNPTKNYDEIDSIVTANGDILVEMRTCCLGENANTVGVCCKFMNVSMNPEKTIKYDDKIGIAELVKIRHLKGRINVSEKSIVVGNNMVNSGTRKCVRTKRISINKKVDFRRKFGSSINLFLKDYCLSELTLEDRRTVLDEYVRCRNK